MTMDKDEDIQVVGTTSDYIVQNLTDEKDGEEFAEGYLKAGFLAAAVDALFYARRSAGLTQAQVAERLHTKQAAIARLEADVDGSMSLRRYVDVALACGFVPLDITLVSIDSARNYAIDNPQAPRTQEAYNTWLLKRSQAVPFTSSMAQASGNTVQPVTTVTIPSQDVRLIQETSFKPTSEQTFGVNAEATVSQTPFTQSVSHQSQKAAA
jgi:transcriptional regulator with XRE-family HTH domain